MKGNYDYINGVFIGENGIKRDEKTHYFSSFTIYMQLREMFVTEGVQRKR